MNEFFILYLQSNIYTTPSGLASTTFNSRTKELKVLGVFDGSYSPSVYLSNVINHEFTIKQKEREPPQVS